MKAKGIFYGWWIVGAIFFEPMYSDEVVKKRKELLGHYCELGRKCIADGAGALIMSCAGMSDIKEYLEQQLKVPVIAGVISAVKIAEQFSGIPRP